MTATAALRELVTFTSGGTPSKSVAEYYSGDIPWITGADIDDGGLISPRTSITLAGIAKSAASVIPAGTVLLVTRTNVGKTAIAPFSLAFSQDITALRPNPDVLNSQYLRHFLRASKTLLVDRARGATIKGVTREDVASLRIPVPSLDEQKVIAETLDRADESLMKRRQSIALLDDLVRSIFLEMFEDAPAGGYGSITVGDLAADRKNSIRTGPFGSQLLHGEFVKSGIPVLGIDNAVNNEFRWAKRRFVTEEKYQKLSRYQVFPGDVIITIMGTCGRCAVVPEDIGVAINTKHLCCISLDRSKCLPEFLHSYFLMHPIARSYLQRTAKGAIMSGLNMNIIKAMPVALPPLAQQERYVAVAREVQDQKLRQLEHLGKLEELFDSLQARAFRGEF